MIDWYGVFRNALWVLGLAVAFAAFSYTDWWRGRQQPKLSLRQALGAPNFQAPFSLGMVLFAAGLALSGDRWWEIAAWAILGVLFAWQAVMAWLAMRRTGGKTEDQRGDNQENGSQQEAEQNSSLPDPESEPAAPAGNA